jgi:hypothetical protein
MHIWYISILSAQLSFLWDLIRSSHPELTVFLFLNSSSTRYSIWTHAPTHTTTHPDSHTPLVCKLDLHLYTKRLYVTERYPKSSRLCMWWTRHPDHCGTSTCEAVLKILGETPVGNVRRAGLELMTGRSTTRSQCRPSYGLLNTKTFIRDRLYILCAQLSYTLIKQNPTCYFSQHASYPTRHWTITYN